ncbi:uncharacterized protein LOC115234529 isoform X2 [Formica exsecta]|uniref:uncharacterized protein LOC115234529 isoform X2 n=1 Tax=Formica exsecta TaxID=72781 RepID=UPI0011451431|nr:uncharacterized protein LOC115234529 isoform X2 [Formica exsecta]
MCFATMMQTIKRIFHSVYSYIAILVFIKCISGPTSDKHTAINEKKNKGTKKWVYNLDDEIKETISPTNNSEDLNTPDIYIDLKIALLLMITIISVLLYCCVYKKMVNFLRRVDPAPDRRNVHYQNNRIVFRSGEHLSDDEMETAL